VARWQSRRGIGVQQTPGGFSSVTSFQGGGYRLDIASDTSKRLSKAMVSIQVDMALFVGSTAVQRNVSGFGVSAQPVDATQALNLSAGVSNVKILRGRSLS
jgi:hypothetical protein